ncbi:MAG: hypothetical protein ACYSRQ_07655 [Planctomycetota bacterium]
MAPVLVSALFLIFAGITLYHDYKRKCIKTSLIDWMGFLAGAVIVIISFCIAGRYINEPDFYVHFSWPLFGMGCLVGVAIFIKCLFQSEIKQNEH